MLRTTVIGLCGLLLIQAGCIEDPPAAGNGGLGAGGGGGGGGGAGGGAGLRVDPCSSSPLAGIDPVRAGMNSCCTKGDAHCVPSNAVSSRLSSAFSDCETGDGSGGLCLPDAVLRAGSDYQPPACASLNGAAGVCLSKCIPQVADNPNAVLLPQATCQEDELCVPCINPLDGKPTGACTLRESLCGGDTTAPPAADGGTVGPMCPYTGPAIIDPATFPACSPSCGGAHCVPSAQVPAAQRSLLAACSGGYCVPDKMIAAAGNNVPATCAPFAGAAAEGRCLSACLPSVSSKAAQLQKATCDTGELCVPCNDPLTGMSTGACATSCDMPRQPAYRFPDCCEAKATCVPSAQVPTAQQSSLEQRECTTGMLCVPKENLPGSTVAPRTCTARLGRGACVSKCAKLPLGGVIFLQDVCTPDQVCVPCALASGVPGCE